MKFTKEQLLDALKAKLTANGKHLSIREKIEESRNKTDDFDGEDEIIAYKPVATTKDEARAKIDIIVDDE